MKVTAIVPSYKPDEKFLKVIDNLCKADFRRIIVVDDGNGEAGRAYFEAATDTGRCVVLHHHVNQGKGCALKTAFNYFLNNQEGDVGVVTLDSDDQQLTEDVVNCAKELELHPDELIIGTRDFNLPHVPKKNAAGNKITAAVFTYLCGIRVRDTQSGLRGLSVATLKKMMQVPGDRFEYETNMLLETKALELPIREVEIATVYHEDSNAGSHYRVVQDSWRVYKPILKFLSSSIVGLAVDLGLFALFKNVFAALDPAVCLFLATALARVASSLVNFTINRKVVFGSRGTLGSTMAKYYLLCAVQMCASWGGVYLLTVPLRLPSMLAKIIVDSLLFFVSFQIQRSWVFADKGK